MDDVRLGVRLAASFSARLRGLLRRDPGYLEPGEVVCFAPCSSVHTLFMHHAIDVAFVDARGRVVRSMRGLRPWRVAACRGSCWAIERFANDDDWPDEGDVMALHVRRAGREGE